MNKDVLVPLDGSALALRALPYAAPLAVALGGELFLLHVADDSGSTGLSAAELEAVADDARRGGARVAAHLYDQVSVQEPARAIAEAAGTLGTGLIVLSTHGRGGLGRLLRGSVAEGVLRQASVPIVLVPAACQRPWPTNRPWRILAPLDGSTLAEAALGPVVELAAALQADLTLLQVVHGFCDNPHDPLIESRQAEVLRYLNGVRARLPVPAETVSLYGKDHPTEQIIAAFARERQIDLVAMATHGRSGLLRVVLGSVATGTLQRAQLPMLLIGPAALPERAAASATLESGP
jgi:nucleotide-binding universal stress UspA family protein